MNKNIASKLDERNLPAKVDTDVKPLFAGFETQAETAVSVGTVMAQDEVYDRFMSDSTISQLAESINLKKKILAEIHIFKLDLDFKRQERRVAKERWEAKKGFFDALGKVGRKIEGFFSPAATMFRAQKDMEDLDENNLRKQFEIGIEGLQDKLDAVAEYVEKHADSDALEADLSKFDSVRDFIIDMKSNPNSPHFQEINDLNKYYIHLAVNDFNVNNMQSSVGIYENSDKERVGVKGLKGLAESKAKQKALNNGLTSAEANMAEIASNSLYVRTMLAGAKKEKNRPEWMSAKLNPMDDVYITYNPQNGEAVILDELTPAQELTSVGMHSLAKIKAEERKEKAKRWFGHGLKAAFAAGMLLLAGKGIVGPEKKLNEDSSKAVASATASAKSGPAASGAAMAAASNQEKVATQVDVPAPKALDKVTAKLSPAPTSQQKAKVSTLPKEHQTIPEGEKKNPPVTKKAPATKRPQIAKVDKKPAVKDPVEIESKKEDKKAEKQDVLTEDMKSKTLDGIIAKITAFQARAKAIDGKITGEIAFFNVLSDLEKIPNELDIVLAKTKTMQTQTDVNGINGLLKTIDDQLSGVENTIRIQELAVVHADSLIDSKLALDQIDQIIAQYGSSATKFEIKKVTSVTKNGKDSSITTTVIEVDLEAAKASLKRIVDRTSDVKQSQADAEKDRQAAKQWIAHIKYVKWWLKNNKSTPNS